MFIKEDFEGVYFPRKTKKLVQRGGEFEYSQVIFHGDRAGLHKDGEFGKVVE